MATAVLLLVGGALVNVAVAWGCAAWVNGWPLEAAPFPSGVSAERQPRWDVRTLIVRRGSAIVAYDCFTVMIGPPPPLHSAASSTEIMEWVAQKEAWDAGGIVPRDERRDARVLAPPKWSVAARQPAPEYVNRIHILEDARGWPCVSLLSLEESVRDVSQRAIVSSRLQWGIPIRGAQGPLGMRRTLPLRPIWPGFAVNTIFYAAVLWMVFAMPGTIRRRRRIKRGLCPACAYPVGTSEVCTECGAALSSRKVASQSTA